MQALEIFDRYFVDEMSGVEYETNYEFMEELYSAVTMMTVWANYYAKNMPRSETEYLILRLQEHIESRLEETFFYANFRFVKLYEREEWSELQIFCLLFAGANDRIRLQQDADWKMTFAEALKVWNVFYGNADGLLERISEWTVSLQKYLLIDKRNFLAETPLFLKASVQVYLCGGKLLSKEAEQWITYWDSEKEIGEFIGFSEIYDRAIAVCTTKFAPHLLLCGEGKNGKRFLVKHIAHNRKRDVLFIDSDLLCQRGQMAADTEDVCLYARLLEADICLYHYQMKVMEQKEVTEEQQSQRLLESYFIREVNRAGIYLYLLSEQTVGRTEEGVSWIKLILPQPDIRTKLKLWKHFLPDCEENGINAETLANRYRLGAGEIKEVTEQAAYIAASYNRKEIEMADIVAAVKQRNDTALGNYADLLETNIYWEDLVVKEEVRKQLEYISDRLKYRNIVEAEWGFEQKISYGKGICALFYGPPGTGKTMAVKALANELGLELYRIDISRMVSKYIGETQKHISELFEHAKHLNALLFFDEADAFFSKRTNVNDSHDRNANSEVAHLLQKLEEYDGISILATNLKDNIDDAFKRRIKYMVHFTLPDIETRKQLWQKMLPKQAPVAINLDLEYFAEQFEMSGSEIKDALIQAAFMAAREGSRITNRHIAEAVRLSFQKYGKILQEEDLGYLL